MARLLHRLRWRWAGVGIVGLALLSLGGIGVHAYSRLASILPPLADPACCPLPADARLGVTAIQLRTADQLTLACWDLPTHNRAAIIILHGEGGNRQTMLAHVRLLAQAGYGVLICDRRAHGASMGSERSWG